MAILSISICENVQIIPNICYIIARIFCNLQVGNNCKLTCSQISRHTVYVQNYLKIKHCVRCLCTEAYRYHTVVVL